jgi:tetratricopeptide (TPR) repeat protein
VREYGQILSNLPVKSYQAIGYYYLAVSYNNCGSGDLDKARELFTLAAGTAPLRYRAKAMLSLAAVSAHLKDPDAELYYFTETLKASKDIATSLTACRGIAVHKAREGYHKQALADLEKILSLARFAPPLVYFNYLNSLAVELGEANRKDEARNVSRILLASPLIPVYPEWRETAEDLRPSRRSMVTVGAISYNVLALPERQPDEPPSRQPKPAQVLDLAKWKNKRVKEKNDEPDENIDAMDRKDLLVKLLKLTTKEDIDEAKLRKIVKFAEATMTRKKPPDKPAS